MTGWSTCSAVASLRSATHSNFVFFVFCLFTLVILRGVFADLHGLPCVGDVTHRLCMIVAVLQSVCRTPVVLRVVLVLCGSFIFCSATTVSTSPPGGNQVDGLPPVASLFSMSLGGSKVPM